MTVLRAAVSLLCCLICIAPITDGATCNGVTRTMFKTYTTKMTKMATSSQSRQLRLFEKVKLMKQSLSRLDLLNETLAKLNEVGITLQDMAQKQNQMDDIMALLFELKNASGQCCTVQSTATTTTTTPATTTKTTPATTTKTTPVTIPTTPKSDPNGRLYISSIKRAIEYTILQDIWGAWLMDPADQKGTVWVIPKYTDIPSMTQYASLFDMIAKRNPQTISFPGFACDGTGHAIWRGHFYCHKSRSSIVVQMNLATRVVKQLNLPDAGFRNQAQYMWGGYSDIDFAVDEMGLWIIYGNMSASGKIALALVDPDTMTVKTTWQTYSVPKRGTGNAFMISGILYALNSYSNPKLINYIYDTTTSTGKKVNIPIPGPTKTYVTQMDYMPGMNKLLIWDQQTIMEYPLTLTTQRPF